METMKIGTDVFLYASKFVADKKSHRPDQIKGILIEPVGEDEIRMVATDGHRLLVVQCRAENPKPCHIKPTKDLLKACKTKTANLLTIAENNQVCVQNHMEQVTYIEADKTAVDLELINAFPSYRQVIPRKESIESVTSYAIDPKLLNDFDMGYGVTLTFTGQGLSPVFVSPVDKCHIFTHILGIVMPMILDPPNLPIEELTK